MLKITKNEIILVEKDSREDSNLSVVVTATALIDETFALNVGLSDESFEECQSRNAKCIEFHHGSKEFIFGFTKNSAGKIQNSFSEMDSLVLMEKFNVRLENASSILLIEFLFLKYNLELAAFFKCGKFQTELNFPEEGLNIL